MQFAELSSLQLQLIGACPLEVLLEPALATLEEESCLSPTHWGIGAGIRDPYAREALLEVARTRPDAAPIILRTELPGRYSAVCYSRDGKASSLELETRGALTTADAATLCAAVSRVAGKIPLDFGSIDIQFKDQDKSTRMYRGGSGHHLPTYRQNGPDLLFARNYFGARLVQLMGGELALANSGFPVERLPNGAMQLDLLSAPWTASPAMLKQRQTRAYEILLRTGILAHRGPDSRPRPGPRWRYDS